MPFGGAEIIILAFIIIFLFGAKKLPEFGRSLGLGMREFKDSITTRGGDEKDEEMPERIDVTAPRRVTATGSELGSSDRNRVSK